MDGIDDDDTLNDDSAPHIDDLPLADLEFLECWRLKSPYINLVKGEVLREWRDDHEACFLLRLTFSNSYIQLSERVLDVGFWWVDARLAGWVDLSEESAKGREKIREYLDDRILHAMADKREELAEIARMEDR